MRITKETLVRVAAIVIVLQPLAYARAAVCTPPDAAKSAEVVSYIVKKYQIASSSNLILTNSVKANDACFWKMEYATTAKQNYVLYLSPDRKYLSPLLFDMSLDPMAETHLKDEQLAKDLLVGTNPGLGTATAPVTIVEFSDFECPFCKRMADTLEKEILPKEGGKVKVVFRNYPLPMHPWAKDAAEIAECAALQKPEAFWAMHDFFFQNQTNLSPGTFQAQAMEFAHTLKDLDQAQFQSCVDRELGLGPVMQDQQLGDRLGVHGTPALYVNGVRFDGFKGADEMTQIIDKALKGELVSPPTQAAPTGSPLTARVASAPVANGAAQCAPQPTRAGGNVNAQ
jgi:protein-disulfide isomerase